MEIKRLTEDNGKILRINESGDHQTNAYQVGQYGVTQIVAYQEFGEHAMLNFIAVYRDGDIWVRLPANNLSIEYFPSKKEQPHD